LVTLKSKRKRKEKKRKEKEKEKEKENLKKIIKILKRNILRYPNYGMLCP
jgi:hypothetical protein